MKKMPVLFVGHGSPMNAIEENSFTKTWRELGKTIVKPTAILAVSAHWYTNGLKISNQENPKTIYDFYGFPKELYEVTYPVKGYPALAKKVTEIPDSNVLPDSSWGIDHGSWSVLKKMFPEADIPVCQLSVDRTASPSAQFEIGQKLRQLREDGVLILGSGNVVHNLGRIGWDMTGGYPWAVEFDGYIKDSILSRQFDKAVKFSSAGSCAKDAFSSPDHFYPLLTILGAAEKTDEIIVFNETCVMGSLSMTGYLFR